MIKSHKIRIYPSKSQELLLFKSCGASRFAYNWGLAKWKELYDKGEKPSSLKIKKLFNEEKRSNPEWKWLYEVTKCSTEYAFINLDSAYKRFFKKLANYPNFHKKRWGNGSFGLANDKFHVNSNFITLPKIGKVRMAEELRLAGKIMKGSVSTFAGKWWISISVELKEDIVKNSNKKSVGIDLGLKTQIATSDNEKFNQPDLSREIVKILKEQRILSRKKKGSKNRLKQIIKFQRAWDRYSNVKNDWVEKITTYLSNQYQYICMEDLNIKGMMKNRKLSGKFQSVSLYRLIERLKTKAEVIQVDRFFPSSKLCSNCGQIKDDLKLSDRVYSCDCGLIIDRDHNAALNILRQAMSLKSVDKKALVI